MLEGPNPTEYASYFETYIRLVPEGDILQRLDEQVVQTLEILASIGEVGASYRYQPDKWSIKEIVGHLADAERIFACRALRFSRRDTIHLPGFEQDDYVKNGGFDRRSLESLMNEFRVVRLASVALFRGFDETAFLCRGTASNYSFTVRSIAYILAGHELHHRNMIQERYL